MQLTSAMEGSISTLFVTRVFSLLLCTPVHEPLLLCVVRAPITQKTARAAETTNRMYLAKVNHAMIAQTTTKATETTNRT